MLTNEHTAYWEEFLTTITRDLQYSGYFSVETRNFVVPNNLKKEKEKFSTELVLYSKKHGNNVVFTVEDLLDNEKLFEKEFSEVSNPCSFAHLVNDEIVLALTGKPGIAQTKIAFVANTNDGYQICIIDYDGCNQRQVTNSHRKDMLNFPRWFPDNKNLILLSYESGWPQLVQFTIKNGNKEVLFGEPGLNSCPSICRKTKEIALVLSKTGNPEIYVADFQGKILGRISYYKGVDSSPSFSPDGENISFVSDRQGRPQIYVMTKKGFGVKRISYGYNYCTCPAWSPDGRFIAYTFLKAEKLGLCLYELKTGKTIVIANDLGCEELTWAPDSRHLVYTQSGVFPSCIRIIDIFTKENRRVTFGKQNCFSSCWSF